MYTKSQIRFWVFLIVIICFATFRWFQVFQKNPLDILDIVTNVAVLTIISTFIQWWGTGIVRSKSFYSKKYKHRKYPTDVDCWNTIQEGVPGVNILIFLVPIIFGYFLSLYL